LFTINFKSPELTAAINRLAHDVRALTKQLVRMSRPSRPSGLAAQLIGEIMDVLKYSVTADPVADGDVVSRRLTVRVNGEQQSQNTHPRETVDFGTVDVAQDAAVEIELVDIDDAGNASPPLVSSFTAVDTLAPTAPTGLGVTLVGETEVA
jgi:hypothetical protein